MNNTFQYFDDIKKTYNLIEYAESKGYIVNKRASTKNYYSGKIVEMRITDQQGNKIDEILVKYVNNKWYYRNRFDDQDWGSIIDFVGSKVLKTDNIREIVSYLNKNPISSTQSNSNNIKIKTPESLPENRIEYFQLLDYKYNHKYLNSRCISDETIKSDLFRDTIMLHPYRWKNGATGYHVAFPIKDSQKKITGALIKNQVGNITISRMLTGSENENSLYIANYPKSYKYDIFVTETPIEALSYYELYKKEFLYLGMNGSHTPLKYEMLLKEISEKRFSGNLTIANNNDLPGFQFNLQILSKIQSQVGLTIDSRIENKQLLIISLKFNKKRKKEVLKIKSIFKDIINIEPVDINHNKISLNIQNMQHKDSQLFFNTLSGIYDPVLPINFSIPYENDFNQDLKKYLK